MIQTFPSASGTTVILTRDFQSRGMSDGIAGHEVHGGPGPLVSTPSAELVEVGVETRGRSDSEPRNGPTVRGPEGSRTGMPK
ncbi:MAG: hypothetical protein AAFV07_06235 [Bacteroidota bacterium]